MSVVIFTKEDMDADKPVPVGNLPPMSFIGGTQNKRRKGNIQGA